VRLFETGYAFLVSRGGTFIAHPEKARIGTGQLAAYADETGSAALGAVAEAVAAGREGNVRAVDPYTGREAVLFYTPLEVSGWSLVAVAPVGEMLAGARTLTVVLLAVGLLALVGLSVAAYVVAGRLARPIVVLSEAARRVADGDTTVRPE